MNYLVFKTDIRSQQQVMAIRAMMVNQKISHWNVDLDDCDHVLRVKNSNRIQEKDVIRLINNCGFYCEVLND